MIPGYVNAVPKVMKTVQQLCDTGGGQIADY